MGWNMESLAIEGNQSGVKTFNYVYTLPEGRNTRTASYRGDGLLLGCGTVRLNREQYIRHTALQHGIDPAELVNDISQKIASEISENRELAQAN